MAIRGITFDLWDTLVHDDSDEPKRAAKGWRSKRDERRFLLWEALNADGAVQFEDVVLAFDSIDVAFNKVWREHFITWPIAERLDLVIKSLGRERPSRWSSMVESIETMEVTTPPDLIPGCAETLRELAQDYSLAVVSDAIVTPGTELRRLLENYGILPFFKCFAFSDEIGCSKPHRRMFEAAFEGLSLKPNEIVHIGDRDHNDIKGAQALGARAILFTATRTIDLATTSADAVCHSYGELGAVVRSLNEAANV